MADTSKPTPNQKLRYERERRSWSQQELADEIGTTPLNISRWERGITSPGPHFRQKLCELFEKNAQQLGLVPESGDKSSVSTPMNTSTIYVSLPPEETPHMLWNIPYRRNLFFTGREDILSHLYVALTMEQPVALTQTQAISGLGGIGKTQTAVEYAYRYRDMYKAVLWARAESHELLVSDFLTIAALLNLSERNEQDQSKVVQAVMRWLDTHDQWLLILDNADQLEMVSEFIPPTGKGHVLLTTRAQAIGTVAQSIELEKMGIDEGALFLLRRTTRLKGNAPLESVSEAIRIQARAIVEVVDGLPLALDQVGAYIEETGCSLVDYLRFYKTRRSRLLKTRGRHVSGHPEPVATTWSLSFEKVKQANPASAELLRLCAFLHPDAIPESIIVAGASELGLALQSVVEDELDLNEAIGELRMYSLVKRDFDAKILNLHRLVQVVVRDEMNKEVEREWGERTVRMVNRAFPEVQFALWSICQQYLPQAEVCAELIKQWNMTFMEGAELLSRMGSYLRQRARYKEAEFYLEKAFNIRKQALGMEHLDVVTDVNNLAGLYVDMGRFAQAEVLYQKVRVTREHILGSMHPDVAATIHDLGALYREQGWFAQAEPFFEQALAIRMETLGLEHLDVALSLSSLAVVLDDQGKYSHVAALYRKALAIYEQVLGSEDPDVATCLNNIGWHYYRQGRYDLVEAPHLRALAIREQGMGADHPDVAGSLNALGLLYRDQGKYVKAELFLRRALMIREQALGLDHVDVGQSLQNLGMLYYRQGKYDEAESLLKRSISIREQLGRDNPIVAYSLNSLAILYSDWNKYDEAEQLFQRTLAIREQAFGKDNVNVAYTQAAFAVLRYKQGRYDEAEELFQRALVIHEQSLDGEHPATAQCLHDLALLYHIRSKYAEAEVLFQRTLLIRQKRLDPEHPDLALTLKHYADLLRKTDREAEAVVLETRIRVS